MREAVFYFPTPAAAVFVFPFEIVKRNGWKTADGNHWKNRKRTIWYVLHSRVCGIEKGSRQQQQMYYYYYYRATAGKDAPSIHAKLNPHHPQSSAALRTKEESNTESENYDQAKRIQQQQLGTYNTGRQFLFLFFVEKDNRYERRTQ